jgi:GH15 family glucan-1,4-alpha-glucosidase
MASQAASRRPVRRDGYLPIQDYAAIGDGRTVALVGLDGAVDWLCLPYLDSPSAFGALLDAERGGSFTLEPAEPYEASRRYAGETNVLETAFETGSGTVRVTDALTRPHPGLSPSRELVRRVEGLSGRVALRWRAEPRFDYGRAKTGLGTRSGVPIATWGNDALSVSTWNAGEPGIDEGSIGAEFELEQGSRALIVLGADQQEPLVFPARDEVETRLDATEAFWKRWVNERTYDGPWRGEVIRSALALKLLIHSPSGAIAAAATTSLPETPGGERNWDYRYCWIRDASFVLDTVLELNCDAESHAFLWWILHASQLTHPKLQVLYTLDGSMHAPERDLPLAGYGGARPVRVGNEAAEQLQLDVYGDLFEAAWLYVREGRNDLDRDTGKRLAEIADLVSEIWREKDAGIWEVRSDREHFTHSKILCWVALDRACLLAGEGQVPAEGTERWRHAADEIRRFVEERCWSEQKQSYVRYVGSEELDAGLLLAPAVGFGREDGNGRLRSTVDAIRRELAEEPFVYRYKSADALEGEEGAFLACSFWLVGALATTGRIDEASALMEELVPLANDVGLYSEEIDQKTGDFLGNFPQGLTHLALIGAAVAIPRAQEQS